MRPVRKIAYSFVVLMLVVGFTELVLRGLAPAGGLIQGELEPTEGGADAIMMRGSPFLLWELAPGTREGPGGSV